MLHIYYISLIIYLNIHTGYFCHRNSLITVSKSIAEYYGGDTRQCNIRVTFYGFYNSDKAFAMTKITHAWVKGQLPGLKLEEEIHNI